MAALTACAGGYGLGNQAWEAWTGECPIYWPVETWDVSLVTDMSGLFSGALSFTSDLSAWDSSQVTDMR